MELTGFNIFVQHIPAGRGFEIQELAKKPLGGASEGKTGVLPYLSPDQASA